MLLQSETLLSAAQASLRRNQLFGINRESVRRIFIAELNLYIYRSSNKSDPKRRMRESHRKLFPPDPSVTAAPKSSFRADFLRTGGKRGFVVYT